MRRVLLVAIGCAIALAPSTAWAKEITGATICGGDGCRAVKDDRLLAHLAEGGDPVTGPSGKAEHFVARITVDGDGEAVRFSIVVLPEQGLLQTDDGAWLEMTPASHKAYVALTNGRKPLAAGRMPAGEEVVEARVDEVVAPPAPASGDASPWPWLGGAALVAVALVLLRWRRRGGGAPAALPQ